MFRWTPSSTEIRYGVKLPRPVLRCKWVAECCSEESPRGREAMYSRLHADAADLTHWFRSCNFGRICPAGRSEPQAQRWAPCPKTSDRRGKRGRIFCCKRQTAHE